MTSEPGSFARATIVERKPQIIAGVLADNAYPPAIEARLVAFRDEIASQPIQPLHEEEVGEVAVWLAEWARYRGCRWTELPWYFAETYFYRRLLEAVEYFQPGPWQGVDPFGAQKRAQEAEAVTQVAGAWDQFGAVPPEARFALLLHSTLWGNRADLSNFTVQERAVGDTTADEAHILIDHTGRVRSLLEHRHDDPDAGRVAFINDNVGADSLFDLILADYLLQQGYARHVTFHLKSQPFFVSDAMPADVEIMIARLGQAESQGLAALGARLKRAMEAGSLELTTHPFWTLPLSFRKLPDALRAGLAENDVIILKGDVNYRRLLADRHWPPETPLEAAAGAFPRPFLVLRTLKGEIIAGLKPGEAQSLEAQDPSWLINGKRGLIHLVC